MPEAVIGRKPKPRVLILGNFDDTTVKRLADMVPTTRRVSSLADVHQPEWDVLITTEPLNNVVHELLSLDLAAAVQGRRLLDMN